jgi:anti-sigma28 factor (negative regulator of flagellin synthesis)
MRINPNVVVSPVAGASAAPERADVKSPKAPEAPATVVTISSARGTRDDISARLDKIRAAIDAGTYPIDLDKLASRIVDDELVRTWKSS